MSEVTFMITEVDRTLSMLREFWMKGKPDEQPKMMDRINVALDRRSELMKKRDTEPQTHEA